ncbi:MAG TPA: S41 family peptidase [Gemmatimonadaceae bacterium]|nr:S41 family peptidase [Gemmatimonadaceae bacterium]
MRWPRAAAVAVILLGAMLACADPTLAPAPSSGNAAIFDAVWRDFDLNYSFFTLKGIDWDSVRAVVRPRAIAAPDDDALARVIGGVLMSLHDRHVSLTTPARTIAYQSAADLAPAPFNPVLIDEDYLHEPTITAGGRVIYGRVAPTIGYIRIPSFGGHGWVSDIDDAIAALRGVRAMIVDVRENGGGTNELAIAAAGRFADASRVFGYVRIRNGPAHDDFTGYIAETVAPSGPRQFRGPVIVLTNRKVYSSAEDFVLATRVLPNVTVVGDTTAGASGNPLVRELPNGWTFQLSTWIEYTPAKRVFENIGLAPDIYVSSTMSQMIAGHDPMIDRAIQLAMGD